MARTGSVLVAIVVMMVVSFIINVGMNSYLVHWNPVLRTSVANLSYHPDTTCDPVDATCRFGMALTTPTGAKACTVFNKASGASCDSACHAADATTVCNGAQECLSVDATDCLGYCNLTAQETDSYVFYGHPDCEGKLTFRPFFYWNSAGSSERLFNQLFYSDNTPPCFLGVCVWYVAILDIISDVNTGTGDYNPTIHAVVDDPLFYLNISNKACIKYITIDLDSNFSTTLYRKSFDADAGVGPSSLLKGRLIQYYYACSAFDEDLLDNADIIQAKRSLSAVRTPPKFDARAKFEAMLSGENIPKIKALMSGSRK